MTHPHGHSHDGPPIKAPPIVQRRLIAVVIPFAVATVIGVFLLWPDGEGRPEAPAVAQIQEIKATVTAVDHDACDAAGQGDSAVRFRCTVVTGEVAEGADAGRELTFNHATGPNGRLMEVGDRILVARSDSGQGGEGSQYYLVDYDRRSPLLILALLFAAFVVALSRWHGLFSLLGVAISLAVLTIFVMPAILDGGNPLAIAIVGAAVIMFVNLYLAHGFNARTTTAILGTMGSLALTGLLAVIFVEVGRFTGFGSEEASFLQLSADQVNLRGLLLGGIIIGTLGVLDDVTITQASAVWELRAANPSFVFADLYRSAIRIGRDHIASTVNTLVLAYAGASLPLLLLFTVSRRPLDDVLNSEVVAEEIVRTLVGSIGLVASVPVTTALAASVVAGGASRQKKKRREKADRRSRHELEWRQGAGEPSDETFWDQLEETKPPTDGDGRPST